MIVCFTIRRSLASLLSGEAKEHQHLRELSVHYEEDEHPSLPDL
jgi:hypothetical protein